MHFKKNKTVLFFYHFCSIFVDPIKFFNGLKNLPSFVWDVFVYSRMEKIKFVDLHPCLHEKTEITSVDPHYLFQSIWALDKIVANKANHHIDVGSSIYFVGALTVVIPEVTFIDMRPLNIELSHLNSMKGNILAMPYADGVVKSLSCLHVAEHIGLGRYGDPLDRDGTMKAARELSRVLAPDGNLLFSLPIGKPRVCFNAHRIHAPDQILTYFSDLKLIEFSVIDDDGKYKVGVNFEDFVDSDYACGLFWFKK